MFESIIRKITGKKQDLTLEEELAATIGSLRDQRELVQEGIETICIKAELLDNEDNIEWNLALEALESGPLKKKAKEVDFAIKNTMRLLQKQYEEQTKLRDQLNKQISESQDLLNQIRSIHKQREIEAQIADTNFFGNVTSPNVNTVDPLLKDRIVRNIESAKAFIELTKEQ